MLIFDPISKGLTIASHCPAEYHFHILYVFKYNIIKSSFPVIIPQMYFSHMFILAADPTPSPSPLLIPSGYVVLSFCNIIKLYPNLHVYYNTFCYILVFLAYSVHLLSDFFCIFHLFCNGVVTRTYNCILWHAQINVLRCQISI